MEIVNGRLDSLSSLRCSALPLRSSRCAHDAALFSGETRRLGYVPVCSPSTVEGGHGSMSCAEGGPDETSAQLKHQQGRCIEALVPRAVKVCRKGFFHRRES